MKVSVVIPVFNEERNLGTLWARLEPVLAPYDAEVIFVDDGSADRSLEILRRMAQEHPDRIKVISFNRNYGQHAAVLAGIEAAGGDVAVTLDADLQNPPEEIPRLLEKVDEGYDVVGTWRMRRKDTFFRRWASRLSNRVTARLLGVPLKDFGCMLRAYRRDVVDSMKSCRERSTFVPALACKFGRRITEIPVCHADRPGGDPSRYSLLKLLKLQADLLTGFSSAPLKLATLIGLVVAFLSIVFGVYLGIRRLVVGPENEGVFTLFAVLFFLMGASFLAMGIMGEYLARIYDEVRARPRSVIKERINFPAVPPSPSGPGAREEAGGRAGRKAEIPR